MQLTKDFQQILIDFFTKYDEKNLKTVPDIIKRFRQNKQQVILHLCNKYNVDINTLDGVDMSDEPKEPVVAAPDTESTTTATEGDEGAPAANGGDSAAGEEDKEIPKKKSKLVMIIIIVVVGLAVLGSGGYFAYDKLVGDGSADKEEVTPEEVAAEPVAESEPEPEPEPAPEPEVVDTTTSDTTATDGTETDGEGGDEPE